MQVSRFRANCPTSIELQPSFKIPIVEASHPYSRITFSAGFRVNDLDAEEARSALYMYKAKPPPKKKTPGSILYIAKLRRLSHSFSVRQGYPLELLEVPKVLHDLLLARLRNSTRLSGVKKEFELHMPIAMEVTNLDALPRLRHLFHRLVGLGLALAPGRNRRCPSGVNLTSHKGLGHRAFIGYYLGLFVLFYLGVLHVGFTGYI